MTAASLVAALDLLNAPSRTRVLRRRALPDGMTDLLRIVAGDPDAISAATRQSGRSSDRIVEAATFFVEQVLLIKDADPYRVLGAPANAPGRLLHTHMTLLLRWAHQDAARACSRPDAASRVTEAWSAVKTPERRAEFDRLSGTRRGQIRRRRRTAGLKRRPGPQAGWFGAILRYFSLG